MVRVFGLALALVLAVLAGAAAADAPPETAPSPSAGEPAATVPAPDAEPKAEPKPESIPAAPPPVLKNVESVSPQEASAILGKKVRGPDGKDILGPVIDVLVDAEGKPRAAIIDFGGFLGVGSRKIAVDWQSLKFKPADRDAPLMLDLSRAEIQAAPEYKETTTHPVEVVEPPPDQPPAAPAPPAVPDAGEPRQ